MSGTDAPKLKRPKHGTPEFTAYMRLLGRRGGAKTAAIPGHLQEIAAAGGRACAKVPRRAKPPYHAASGPDTADLLADIDAFLSEIEHV